MTGVQTCALPISDGTLVDHLRYTAYGSIAAQTNASYQPRFTYTGRELNQSLGLYDYRARYYDPVLGRFLSEDPIGFRAGDANLYRYVGNNPMVRVDPFGTQSYLSQVGEAIRSVRDVGVGESYRNMSLAVGYTVAEYTNQDVGAAVAYTWNLPGAILGAGKEFVTGTVGFVGGLAKGTTAAAMQAAAFYTGSAKLQSIANDWSKDTLDPLMNAANRLMDPCTDLFQVAFGGVHNWIKEQNRLAANGQKIEGAVNLGGVTGSMIFNTLGAPLLMEAGASALGRGLSADDEAAAVPCDGVAERLHDVDAQTDAGQEDVHAPPCQPPASPLYVPRREKSVPTVRSMIDRSSLSDWCSTYQTSSSMRSAHGRLARPWICAQPVMPGVTSRRRRCRSSYCSTW